MRRKGGKRLNARDAEIVEKYFKDGMTQETIAMLYGISHQRVSAILRKPEAAKHLETMKTTSREIARARVMMAAEQAANEMVALLGSKNEQQRYLAALDLLNRAKVEEQKSDPVVEIVFEAGFVEIGEEQPVESNA